MSISEETWASPGDDSCWNLKLRTTPFFQTFTGCQLNDVLTINSQLSNPLLVTWKSNILSDFITFVKKLSLQLLVTLKSNILPVIYYFVCSILLPNTGFNDSGKRRNLQRKQQRTKNWALWHTVRVSSWRRLTWTETNELRSFGDVRLDPAERDSDQTKRPFQTTQLRWRIDRVESR